MKPTGPEIISSYPPNLFTKEDLKNIAMKSIPLNAKVGDFSTFLLKEDIGSGLFL